MGYYGDGYTKEFDYHEEFEADNNAIYEYGYGSEFDIESKDSAVKKLFEAFYPILVADGGRYNNLCRSVSFMEEISSILSQTNGGLGNSWTTASENCKKMESKISNIIIDVVKVVNSYIEATYAEELNASKATEKFNEDMNNINNALNDLDNL